MSMDLDSAAAQIVTYEHDIAAWCSLRHLSDIQRN
ncbi:Uncharacterised protein [Chlamydia trachomatis]|nr:Uncharacterised protein [Chlamydia trachomatis]